MPDFYDIIEQLDDAKYVNIETDELTLSLLPFYALPARKIADLYSKQKNNEKFIKALYNFIYIAMEHPDEFKHKVYDSGITYTGLVKFINEWVLVSNIINKYELGEIDDNGEPTTKTTLNTIEVMQNIMFNKLSKGEEVKTTMLIRYLSENIRQLAITHNETATGNDIITEVHISIPIKMEFDNE